MRFTGQKMCSEKVDEVIFQLQWSRFIPYAMFNFIASKEAEKMKGIDFSLRNLITENSALYCSKLLVYGLRS